MAKLIWDQPGKRVYETGVDQGVLYHPDGTAYPWNGLTSVVENFAIEKEPIFYEGVLVSVGVKVGAFTGSANAVTYPPSLEELLGAAEINCGISLGHQTPKRFGMSYRTMIGDDIRGVKRYKIHIVWNVLAAPGSKSNASSSDSPAIMDFSWELDAIPESIPGFRPTATLEIDSRFTDPKLLIELERLLYGDNASAPSLPSMLELVELIQEWRRLRVTDNGDGTWTAEDQDGEYISTLDGDIFTIDVSTAVPIDEDTYLINDLTCVGPDSLQIEIIDNGNGTWSANSPYDGLFEVDPETGYITIRNATLELQGTDTYRITDTPAQAEV